MQYKELRGDVPLIIQVGYMAANVTGGFNAIVPFSAKVTAAKWIPGAAITANGTNFFTLSVFNRGAAGAGTVELVTARSYAATNGVKATPEALTLSATEANLFLAAGDVVSVECAPAGSGLICPGGAVQLTLRGR